MSSYLIAILAGLGAMLGWGISDFFVKKSLDKIDNLVFMFWFQLVSLISLTVYVPFSGQWQNFPYEQLPELMLLTVVSLLALFMFFRALKSGKVSVISPISASYAIFVIPVSMFFFKEQVSSTTLIILGVIILGIILTSLDIKGILQDGLDKGDLSKGVPSVLTNVAILTFFIPFWDNFISDKSWLMSLFLFKVLSVLILSLIVLFKKVKVKISNHSTMKWIIISALLYSLASVSFDWGFGVTPHTSLVTVLSAAFFVPTLILGRIFLKEKLQPSQWLGVGLILMSLMALVFV